MATLDPNFYKDIASVLTPVLTIIVTGGGATFYKVIQAKDAQVKMLLELKDETTEELSNKVTRLEATVEEQTRKIDGLTDTINKLVPFRCPLAVECPNNPLNKEKL